MNDNIQYVSFSVWFILLGVIVSRSTCVGTDGSISIFFMTEWYSSTHTPHIFLSQRAVGEYLGCFRMLVTVNTAAVNTGMYLLRLVLLFSLDIYLGVVLLNHTVVLFLAFLGNLHAVFHGGYSNFTFPPTVYDNFPFSTSSPTFVICKLFDDSYSDLCVALICISLIISDSFPLFFLLSLAKDLLILFICKKQNKIRALC